MTPRASSSDKPKARSTTAATVGATLSGYRWTHILGVTTAVTAVGIVGGAYAAAPGETWALAGSVSRDLYAGVAGLWGNGEQLGALKDTWQSLPTRAAAAGHALTTASPRTLLLAASGLLAASLGTAAAVLHWRGRMARNQRHPGIELLVSRAAAGEPSMPLASRVPSLRMLNRDLGRDSRRDAGRDSNRRRGQDRTPKHIRALAAQGAAPADIARRTGLSLDAVALCLAVSSSNRQLPPNAA